MKVGVHEYLFARTLADGGALHIWLLRLYTALEGSIETMLL